MGGRPTLVMHEGINWNGYLECSASVKSHREALLSVEVNFNSDINVDFRLRTLAPFRIRDRPTRDQVIITFESNISAGFSDSLQARINKDLWGKPTEPVSVQQPANRIDRAAQDLLSFGPDPVSLILLFPSISTSSFV